MKTTIKVQSIHDGTVIARRSKYNFATLEVHGELKVKGIDVYSVKNSLAGYNKRAKKNIVIASSCSIACL